jgi:drug/metabolite transporter (DMT)-like permease
LLERQRSDETGPVRKAATMSAAIDQFANNTRQLLVHNDFEAHQSKITAVIDPDCLEQVAGGKPASSSPYPASTPLIIIAFGGALTGFSGIFVRLSETGPLATGGWRLAIAALVLLSFLRLTSDFASARKLSPLLVVAGLFFAVDMSFFNLAVGLTSVAHATLIVNLAPVVLLGAGFLLFQERFGAAKILGVNATLCGAALMTLTRADSGGTLAGNGLAVLGMLGFSVYLVAIKQARRDHDTWTIMFWSSATAAAAMFGAALIAGEQLLPVTTSGWAILIALGLISHLFGQGLVAFGMGDAPVGLGSILLLTQPIVAALAACALFNESMGPVEACGAALILAGLVIASRARA